MPVKRLDAHATLEGELEFRDPSNDNAWLATDQPKEVVA